MRSSPARCSLPEAREINKLAGLSAKGRSSATTLLVSSALRWMNTSSESLPPDRRRILAFTDNRQDAALQVGHFNDFLFVSLLRAAILEAVCDAGAEGITYVLARSAASSSMYLGWGGMSVSANLARPDARVRSRLLPQSEVDIGRGEVVEAFALAPVIMVLDEGGDLRLKEEYPPFHH